MMYIATVQMELVAMTTSMVGAVHMASSAMAIIMILVATRTA
jgi:hypothetical protein